MNHTWKAQMGGFLRGGIIRSLYDLKYQIEARYPDAILEIQESKDFVHSEYWIVLRNASEEAVGVVEGVLREIFEPTPPKDDPKSNEELSSKELLGCMIVGLVSIVFLIGMGFLCC